MRKHPTIIERARELRRNMTPAEGVFWKHLRGRRFAGFKFRRQHPMPPFIVDFYCSAAGLILEIDGETHLGKEALDQERQRWLESHGLTVLRFWNTTVYDDLEPVLELIWRECTRSNKPLTPGPSPLGGEGRQGPSPFGGEGGE